LLVCGVTTEVCVNTTVREMGGGSILTGLVLGAVGVFVIERDFIKASAFAFSGAVLTYFGFMHGEAVGIGGGMGVTPSVALAYAVVAAAFYAVGKYGTSGLPVSQTEMTHAVPANEEHCSAPNWRAAFIRSWRTGPGRKRCPISLRNWPGPRLPFKP
jgi:hypothetical protein